MRGGQALAVRKKGAVESQKVVEKRLEEMGLRGDEVMTYRLGGGPLWYSCWVLLDEGEKQEARARMRGEARAACKKSGGEGTPTSTQRAQEMGLGENEMMLYTMGSGAMYYDIWDLLDDGEQETLRLQMQTNLTVSSGVGLIK